MNTNFSIALAGGGTGGHITPAIAIAERLPPSVTPVFLGCGRRVESELLADYESRYRVLPHDAGRDGESPLSRTRHMRVAVREAKRILRREATRAVVGLGGYVSIPTLIAAKKLGLPITLLEQNAVPGRATELFATSARRILAAMPFEEPLPRTVVVGNPLRDAIVRAERHESGTNRILILGGSQGAAALNQSLPPILKTIPDVEIVHQCGAGHTDVTAQHYAGAASPVTITEMIDDIAGELATASIAIARAGATTIAELAAIGVPSVLIPHPAAIRDHQWANGRFAAATGGCALIEESQIAEALPTTIGPLLRDGRLREWRSHQLRRLAKPDAADRCVELLLGDVASADRRAA